MHSTLSSIVINNSNGLSPFYQSFPSLRKVILRNIIYLKDKTSTDILLKLFSEGNNIDHLQLENCRGIITSRGLDKIKSLRTLVIRDCGINLKSKINTEFTLLSFSRLIERIGHDLMHLELSDDDQLIISHNSHQAAVLEWDIVLKAIFKYTGLNLRQLHLSHLSHCKFKSIVVHWPNLQSLSLGPELNDLDEELIDSINLGCSSVSKLSRTTKLTSLSIHTDPLIRPKFDDDLNRDTISNVAFSHTQNNNILNNNININQSDLQARVNSILYMNDDYNILHKKSVVNAVIRFINSSPHLFNITLGIDASEDLIETLLKRAKNGKCLQRVTLCRCDSLQKFDKIITLMEALCESSAYNFKHQIQNVPNALPFSFNARLRLIQLSDCVGRSMEDVAEESGLIWTMSWEEVPEKPWGDPRPQISLSGVQMESLMKTWRIKRLDE